MKTRKLSLTLMLAVAAWCSAWAYSPTLGGEEKPGKGRENELSASISSPNAEATVEIPAEDVLLKSDDASTGSSVVGTPAKSETAIAGQQSTDVKHSAATTARRDVRNALKNLRKENRNSDRPSAPLADDMMIICVILCFFIPPLAIYLWENSIGINFWISLILTLLFWLPGVIFSLIVVLTT